MDLVEARRLLFGQPLTAVGRLEHAQDWSPGKYDNQSTAFVDKVKALH